MRVVKRTIWLPVLLCGAMTLFFVLLFYVDNKYQAPPPYGKNGVLTLSESDLYNSPVFLIDGWLLTDSRSTDLPTYIGEFSGLQRGCISAPVHGKASYKLTLRYSGEPLIVEADFPRLSTDYAVLLDGKLLTSGVGNAEAVFYLQQGEQTLEVQTSSSAGYYSGMYFPPALGKPQVISKINVIKSFAYALAFLAPLVLACFTFVLWRQKNVLPAFWLGMLCCFYALYVAHYFVYLFKIPLLPYWNFVEGFALYGTIFCVLRLTALASGMTGGKTFLFIQRVLVGAPLLLLLLYICIPVFPQAVMLHGVIKDLYLMFTFCSVLFLAAHSAAENSFEHIYILAGCVIFGAGLVMNLFFSNSFEPILFFWQFEWCGLFLVFLFGKMMAVRNKRILDENDEFSRNLEQLVEKRTNELSTLLAERKAFFSDMAHDLKAPIFATQAFIRAIRQNGTGIDGELAEYIDAAEQKQMEMAMRVQGLSELNRFDRIVQEREIISVNKLLDELYAAHNAEAEVSSIHLLINPPAEDCYILAQAEKLDILFENLIYNAIRATPAEGSIIISAGVLDGCIYFKVEDSGCGIPEDELPHIFDRFFVGAKGNCGGTGLGLYIVKSIVTELGGELKALSKPGEGTQFFITLPTA